METVSVNRIPIYPCGYWRGLVQRSLNDSEITSTGFERNTWPPHSSIWCWYCCHSFNTVPVYLPVEVNEEKNTFYFTGNFCSWNCVKGYAGSFTDRRPPKAVVYISLLAFLTAHRPRHCLYTEDESHSYKCPCTDMFKGVELPPKKELLHTFGGTLSIEEYRKDFLTVESYDWVNTYFNKNNAVRGTLASLTSNPKRRAYTFSFLSYPGPKEATVDHVYILPLTNKTVAVDHTNEIGTTTSTTSSSSSKKKKTPCGKSATSRRRYPKSSTPAPIPSNNNNVSMSTETIENTGPIIPITQPQCNVEPIVSEEQKFYIQSVNQYGNLFSSMGIRVEKKGANS